MMTRRRIVIVATLASAPFLFLMAVGSYHLWETRWWFWAWWPMAICWGLAYLLAWRWQRRTRLAVADIDIPFHWTPRDHEAWKQVVARAAKEVPAEELTNADFYWHTVQDLAITVARSYDPEAPDPYGRLTVPEILTVGELAAHDLAELVNSYVPGSHLMTIGHWKRAHGMIGWYRKANQAMWALSALADPVRTGLRYLASRYGLGKSLDKLQENVIGWFYSAFVQKVGYYLIELHSGRLRVGAARYLQLLKEHGLPAEAPPEVATLGDGATPETETTAPETKRVTITVIGQVKAGKSSLINALLGESLAQTDVIPATAQITRYELKPEGLPGGLFILDTRGYGHAGPDQDELEATEEAVTQSDLIILVVHARNPAREPDVALLDRLKDWMEQRQHLKLPPVVVAMTHVDLLSPQMEWAPPYDWRTGSRPKERQMAEAADVVREQFGQRVTNVVPVCAAEGRVFNVEDELLPALLKQLDEARGVGLLRALHAEADANKIRRVFEQIKAAGWKVFDLIRESFAKK